MRKILLLAFVFWLVACQKDDLNVRSEGQVVGYDLRLCACCGGWYLEIDGETYRADLSAEDVARLNLETPALPVLVRLDWKLKENPCLGDEIIVTRIERR